MAQQLFTLNTNIRYLHEKLVLHAEKLTSTMPQALEVRSLAACDAVCEHSEALSRCLSSCQLGSVRTVEVATRS